MTTIRSAFLTVARRWAIIIVVRSLEREAPWSQRDLPITLYDMLDKTANKMPDANAVSFQLMSGPNSKAETLSWSQLRAQVIQAANLFSRLGIGESDVVAFVLPNSMETVVALLGGAVAGIVSPINPLLCLLYTSDAADE